MAEPDEDNALADLITYGPAGAVFIVTALLSQREAPSPIGLGLLSLLLLLIGLMSRGVVRETVRKRRRRRALDDDAGSDP